MHNNHVHMLFFSHPYFTPLDGDPQQYFRDKKGRKPFCQKTSAGSGINGIESRISSNIASLYMGMVVRTVFIISAVSAMVH